jgi:hypothetical protein
MIKPYFLKDLIMNQRKVNHHPERIKFWANIIRNWQKSGLSQAAFCRQNNLTSSAFYAWHRRFRDGEVEYPFSNEVESESASNFIPVQILPEKLKSTTQTNELSETIIVRLPNSLEIEITLSSGKEQLLPLLKQLAEV